MSFSEHSSDVRANDGRFKFSGFLHLDSNADRTRATRQFGTSSLDGYGNAASQSSGLHVRWRSAAQHVVARLNYRTPCDEACAIDLDKTTCYSKPKCHSQCEPKLLVDGLQSNASCIVASGVYRGDHECRWVSNFDDTRRYAPHWAVRDFELVFPWGAEIDFKGLHLVSQDLPWDMTDATIVDFWDRPRVRLVAYGDSITHGWCGRGDSYVEWLARLTDGDIDPINMGIQGLSANAGATAAHGDAIAQLQPDVVTVMIGVNDLLGGAKDPASTAGDVMRIVDDLRARKPWTPIVLITPTFCTWADSSLEALRKAMRAEALERRRTDKRLFLVEGQALLPKDRLVEGLHPTSEGKESFATALLSELGYSRVHFKVISCGSFVELALSGLTPGGQWIIFRGKSDLITHKGTFESHVSYFGPTCKIAVPFKQLGSVGGVAEADGTAIARLNIGTRCEPDAAWIVIDMTSCAQSRSGSPTYRNSTTINTPAAFLPPLPSMAMPPLPPSAPSPVAPPPPRPSPRPPLHHASLPPPPSASPPHSRGFVSWPPPPPPPHLLHSQQLSHAALHDPARLSAERRSPASPSAPAGPSSARMLKMAAPAALALALLLPVVVYALSAWRRRSGSERQASSPASSTSERSGARTSVPSRRRSRNQSQPVPSAVDDEEEDD